MKKNLKKLVISLVLAVSVLASVVPAQAGELAPKVSKKSCNNWNFSLSNRTMYEGQIIDIKLGNSFHGTTVTYKSSEVLY